MTIQKILVPVDGSLLADAALGAVRRILKTADAEVTLLTVVRESEIENARPGQDRVLQARQHLDGLRDALVAEGARAEGRVVVGDPATRILESARSLGPSLIALSTHGRTGLERFAHGSIAERILRHSPYPVLLVNPRSVAVPRDHRFRRILVPLDGSEFAAEVLPLAKELARLHASEIVLFHSVDVGVYLDPVPAVSPAETPADVERLFEKFKRRLEGVPVRVRSTMGEPASAILEAAESESVDLIALTTHGRSGPTRWLFGSIAEKVVRHAACPVLVHRTGGFTFDEHAQATSATASHAPS